MSARGSDTAGGVAGSDAGQGVEGLAGLFLAHRGEMQVDEGGLERGVPEVGGELVELGAAFEHVGRVAVTQSVGADFLVGLAESALGGGDLNGAPDAGFGHVVSAVVHGLAHGDAGGFPTAPDSGKEPSVVAMEFPEGAQSGEQGRGDGNFAGLASFAVPDADQEALAINVLGLEREPLAHAQAGLVEQGEVGPVATVPKGGQETGDLIAGEDMREWCLAADFDLGPDLPFEVEVVTKEGAQGTDRLIDGGPGQFAFVLKMEQEIKDLTALETGQMLPRIVVGELPDPAEVGFDRALAEPFELDKAGVLLIPLL